MDAKAACVVKRALPSFEDQGDGSVSATAKLAPLMPMSASAKLSRQQSPSGLGQ